MRTAFALVILLGLGAVIGAIVVGQRSFDGLVVDGPYERGLAWDETRRAREESGFALRIEPLVFTTGSNQLVAHLDSPEGPVRDATVELLVTRPHTTAEDRRVVLEADSAGGYRAEVAFGTRGAWELAFTVIRHETSVELRRKIWVQGTALTPPAPE